MATVVVTGASGFLGRHVVTHVSLKGDDVVAVSRRAGQGMHQVTDYAQSPAGDILVHLAGEADRSQANRLGVDGLRSESKVAKALCSGRYRVVVYASSAAVYGDQHESPCGVDTPVVADDAYSQSKLEVEQIVLAAGGVVVRLSNLYGPGMSANSVLSDILNQIPGEGPLRVRNETPIRDFLAVSDAARAFGLLTGTPHSGVVNVGSGVGISVRALAALALASAGEGGRAIVSTHPSPKRSINVVDISQTTQLLGWSPTLSLPEQLRELNKEQVWARHG